MSTARIVRQPGSTAALPAAVAPGHARKGLTRWHVLVGAPLVPACNVGRLVGNPRPITCLPDGFQLCRTCAQWYRVQS